MSNQLVYSPESLADLQRIWLEVWEASKDFDITERYIEDLRNTIRKKLQFPESGTPLYSEGEFTGVYYVPFKAYLIFYRVRGDRLEVGRILFGGSDYMKTLFGDQDEQKSYLMEPSSTGFSE